MPEISTERANELRLEGLKEIEPYLKLISEQPIRDFTRKCLEAAPVYFWHIPASSSGKYHPSWAVQECGLLRHVVLTAYLADELSHTFGLTSDEHDIAVAAALLHDTLKYGINYDVRYHDMHSYLPRNYFLKEKKIMLPIGMSQANFKAIFDAVDTHMGSIATGAWNPVNRVIPQTLVEQVVHLADYVASRKKINFSDF